MSWLVSESKFNIEQIYYAAEQPFKFWYHTIKPVQYCSRKWHQQQKGHFIIPFQTHLYTGLEAYPS